MYKYARIIKTNPENYMAISSRHSIGIIDHLIAIKTAAHVFDLSA